MTTTVALDCMGGDHGPQEAVRGAAALSLKRQDIRLILVGDAPILSELLDDCAYNPAQLSIEHAAEWVEQHEKPREALKAKPKISPMTTFTTTMKAPKSRPIPTQRAKRRDNLAHRTAALRPKKRPARLDPGTQPPRHPPASPPNPATKPAKIQPTPTLPQTPRKTRPPPTPLKKTKTWMTSSGEA